MKLLVLEDLDRVVGRRLLLKSRLTNKGVEDPRTVELISVE
jgi:hypothetical protein